MSTIEPQEQNNSPPWGSTIKLIVGVAIVAIFGATLIQFRNIIGPLLLALILAYVFHPVAGWLSKTTKINWRMAVNLLYLLAVVALVGMFTALGLAVAQQAQNLIKLVNLFIIDLPSSVEQLTSQSYTFGPFSLALNQETMNTILNELVGMIQPALSQTGSLVGSVASGTLTTLGWIFFILMVSYFILADANNVPFEDLAQIRVPGYDTDFRRLAKRLILIWDSFLRGQFFLFIATIIASALLMSALGLRNALALAILAGMARFVPYVGPFVTWVVTAVVALFMPENYFGLEPYQYVILVVVAAIILDQAFDNVITPRLYGQALGIHPAAVLVAAIVAANLLGFIGLLLAAPVLATMLMFGRYTIRKMLDLDPWPEEEQDLDTPQAMPGTGLIHRVWAKGRKIIHKRRKTNEQRQSTDSRD